MSRLRGLIARRMVESLQVSAQLTTVVEADLTGIARLRDRAQDAFAAREGVRLSFLPFFAVAVVEALKVHPMLNSSVDLDAGTITYHDEVRLGIAVDTDRGPARARDPQCGRPEPGRNGAQESPTSRSGPGATP